MNKSKFSEEQVVRILQEAESGKGVREVCRAHGHHPVQRVAAVAAAALGQPVAEDVRATRGGAHAPVLSRGVSLIFVSVLSSSCYAPSSRARSVSALGPAQIRTRRS